MSDSDELWFFKLGNSLIPTEGDAAAAVKSMTQGEAFPVKILRHRNLGHHKKYWALLNLVATHQEKYPSAQVLHVHIKLAAGWYDIHVAEDGKPVYVPRSIAFGAMDQPTFEKYYREACEAIVRLLPQFNAEWLLDQVVEFTV